MINTLVFAVIATWNMTFVVRQVVQQRFEPADVEYSGSQLTPEIIKNYKTRYSLLEEARVLHFYDIEVLTGGQTTVHFELPASQLNAFLKDSLFYSAKFESNYTRISPLKGTSWLSHDYLRKLDKTHQFQSAAFRDGPRCYGILIDKTDPKLYAIYIQESD